MKQQPNENLFAEFLAQLKSQADEQDKAKVEQLRKLFAAASAESFPAFESTGKYAND